jgi:Cysteine-rich secretory protein family
MKIRLELFFVALITGLLTTALLALPACVVEDDDPEAEAFVLGESDYSLSCDPTGDGADDLACQLAYFTNRQRSAFDEESDNALPLDWNNKLAATALDYSNRMCDEGFFDHKDPNGNDMENRLQDDGIFYAKAGENLARGNGMLPSEVMSLFMDEPSCQINHRGNVLDNDFTHTGVGAVFCGDKTIYTQLFATFDAEDLRDDENGFCND